MAEDGGTRPTIVLVPTTCASGAEGASVAVYSDGGRKRPVVSPLFLAEVKWSAVFGAYVCVCEDDVADDLAGVEELVKAYARAGWRELRRVSLFVQPPRWRVAS